jgi:hypothetical protein
MIGDAYSQLPDPDPLRLQMIERHLIDQLPCAKPSRTHTRISWWGFGLLVFAASAAAWWAINYHNPVEPVLPQNMEKALSTPLQNEPISAKHKVNSQPQENTATQAQKEAKNSHKIPDNLPEQSKDERSTVIYKREVF